MNPETFTRRKLKSGSVLRHLCFITLAVSAIGVNAQAETRVEAEDYTSFSDTDSGNNGGAYRSDNVDIEATSDSGGGFNVGWTQAGEWLEYSVGLASGTYEVSTRVASNVGGGNYIVSLDGTTIGSDSVDNTGGWQAWQTHSLGSISVGSGGPHTLRVDMSAGNFNINWIEFISTSVDSDGDGVVDENDDCPNTPANTVVDIHGCEDSGPGEGGLISATASGSTNFQAASLATDDNLSTRWESNHGVDPSILTLDFGAAYDVSQVEIYWEAANAANYSIEGSNDNSSWSTVATYTGGTFGDRTDTLAVSGSYRYLRMNGTSRSVGNYWGYSIYEMDVYGTLSDSSGDVDSDSDGVIDGSDLCPNTPAGTDVDTVGCPIVDNTGDITPLYNASTALEPDTQFETADALVTRFSDRPRTRHAREDEFQSYDHYIKFYFEDRSSNIEIVDEVAKGGDTVTMNVRTIFPLNSIEAENRWWYTGFTTVASYASNGQMEYLGFDGVYYNYRKSSATNTRLGRAIELGDRMEFEISQFSDPSIPRGQSNYYGTTFLYIVGEGVVPWYTEVAGTSQFREDSAKIPEEFWLGGNTSIHYNYTNETNDHFMQMATNLGYDNAQTFLEGRRVHHSSFVDGIHDEDVANGVLDSSAGLTGERYINERCSDCHERNGGAPVADNGELLDRWVFKIGDQNGDPTADKGRVLQPNGAGGEGDVSIASWTETAEGLRTPNYQFSDGTPATFSARIAPRLVGLGLLEAIPEASILALADENDANGDGISGRVNMVVDPENASLTRLGRFGWKATASSVRHQTAGALNTDIGVRTSVLPNPDCGSEQTNCGENSPMMPDENLDKLVTYLSTLGVRPQRVWKSGVEDTTVLQGRDVFGSIGCVDCHTETFQTSSYHPLAEVRNQTVHPYSDMLLHDMGPDLADNLGDGLASGSEWRTTPLWGLGLAACVTGGVTNPTGAEGGEICTPHHAYLHDGRARTIDEAVRWHGGEGDASKQAYENLSATDKDSVLAFLNSL